MLDRLRDLLGRRRGRAEDDSRSIRRKADARTDAMVVGQNLGAELHNPDVPAGAPVNWVRPVDEGRPRK